MRRGYRPPFAKYLYLFFSPNGNSLVRVSEFVALAIAELQANGYVIGHITPLICDTLLTLVEGEKVCLASHLSQARNQLSRQTFLVNKYKSYWQPMHFGEWCGFLVNNVAMNFQIPEEKTVPNYI